MASHSVRPPVVDSSNDSLGFELVIADGGKVPARADWTYSPQLNLLLCKIDSKCPIAFRTSRPIPGNVRLRISPKFSRPEDRNTPVLNCPTHLTEHQGNGNQAPEHMAQCDSDTANYVVDRVSKHHSCWIDARVGRDGCLDQMESIRMMCFSSCSGGPNRRPIELQFTLEQENRVLAMRKLDVRVCACPARDRKLAEKTKEGSASSKRRRSKDDNSVTAVARLSSRDTDEEFVLPIQDRETYEIARKIAQAIGALAETENDGGAAKKRRRIRRNISTVTEWLKDLGLQEYASSFQQQGYDDLELCEHLTAKDLDAIGVRSHEHQQQLLQGAAELAEQPRARSNCLAAPNGHGERMVRIVVRRGMSQSGNT
eukprot:m.101932 g.101932  ORF g.101932 m.101932 type:complete len:370 (+) comp8981_c0_seq4:226-1335(+)